jgi:hypothetical protein
MQGSNTGTVDELVKCLPHVALASYADQSAAQAQPFAEAGLAVSGHQNASTSASGAHAPTSLGGTRQLEDQSAHSGDLINGGCADAVVKPVEGWGAAGHAKASHPFAEPAPASHCQSCKEGSLQQSGSPGASAHASPMPSAYVPTSASVHASSPSASAPGGMAPFAEALPAQQHQPSLLSGVSAWHEQVRSLAATALQSMLPAHHGKEPA